MIFISMIFFIFGFVTTFNITLSESIQKYLLLQDWQGQLVNSAFFIAYPLFAFAAGAIIRKIGYKNSVVSGLVLVALGGVLFLPAIMVFKFGMFLMAIFVLATGVVLLQTAANPYVVALGSPEKASGRLNLTQALNSIATWIAPIIIGVFIVVSVATANSAEELTFAQRQAEAGSLKMPFILIASMVFVIAIVLKFLKLPEIDQSIEEGSVSVSIWKHKHVVLGAIAIFAYVGAEVGIGGMVRKYLVSLNIEGIGPKEAALYTGLYWGGAMIGRLFGSISLSGIAPKKMHTYASFIVIWAFIVGFVTVLVGQLTTPDAPLNISKCATMGGMFFGVSVVNYLVMQLGKGKTNIALSVFAIAAAALALISVFSTGYVALWTILSIGFFNSIMFPNIFALGVDGLKKSEMSMASGLINSLIVGGAAIPPLMGLISDKIGTTYAFILPAICYVYILYYALVGSKHD
jgi:FHS family L-fucose permease-like MFS transporter